MREEDEFCEGKSSLTYIYKIENMQNGKIYIGCTKDFNERRCQHLRFLKKGQHKNKEMQKDWTKQQGEGFVFVIIKSINCADPFVEEAKVINELGGVGSKRTYNKNIPRRTSESFAEDYANFIVSDMERIERKTDDKRSRPVDLLNSIFGL